jgi:hypothetical protein
MAAGIALAGGWCTRRFCHHELLPLLLLLLQTLPAAHQAAITNATSYSGHPNNTHQ